jgi:serine/threonine protein kinase
MLCMMRDKPPLPDRGLDQMPKITPVETPDPEGPTAVGVPDKLKPGKIFAWFELERELEQGSTGAVWLAQDYSVGRQAEQVVLRFLPERLASNKAAVEKLTDEIQRRSALNHPNILHTYGVIESRGRVAIKMEYLDGQSLASLRLTRPNQVFEVRELEIWVKKACQALAYAHQEIGLIHGDIAPGNLVVDRSGELRLKNFGIEDSIAASMGRAPAIHNVAEILPYRSPERAAGEEPAITDDLYSLGATLYELLTSKPALYAGEIGDRASGKVLPAVAERRAELGIEGDAIPQIWEETVAACLAKDPVERPQSAKEIEQRLVTENSPEVPAKDALNALPEPAPKRPPWVRTLPVRTRWLVIAGILFILAFGSVLGFFLFHRATKLEQGGVVLNAIPGKSNVLLDGAHSPAPTVRPSFPASSTKESSPAVPTPAAEVSQNPSLDAGSTPGVEASPTPSSGVKATPSAGVNPASEASPAPSSEGKATPSTQETATSTETASVSSSPTPLNQQDAGATKEDVIRRINAMPGVTAAKKANLIEKMNKARSMERLVVIPFENGRSTLRRSAADELVKSLATPEMREKLSDPTSVLVVAGYADAGGRADVNLRISQARAENVSRILKEQAGLLNATQTIGMGGTELLDSDRPDQNRAVEIWVVVPL